MIPNVFDVVEGTHSEVLSAGGFWWRVQRVTNEDVRRRNGVMLLLIMPMTEAERAEDEEIQAMPDDQRATALVRARYERFKRRLEADPARGAYLRTSSDAILRAGVTHIGLERDDLAPLILVETETEATPKGVEASPRKVWIDRFNPSTRDVLFQTIWNLCTDGGAAVERIERFRRGAGDAGAP